jgi:hypothetical protein
MLSRLIYVFLFSLLLFSCSSVANLRTADNPELSISRTNPADVKVYSTADIGKDFMIIGQVVASADAGTNSEKAVNHLKEEAAKLGADAIINLRLEIDSGYWQNAIKATGVAVKYN